MPTITFDIEYPAERLLFTCRTPLRGCSPAGIGLSVHEAGFARLGPFIRTSLSPMIPIMSQPSPAANYQFIFDSAIEDYGRKTGKDLASDPLLRRLEVCHSPDDIIAILREHIPGLDYTRGGDDRLTKSLTPTVNVLSTFSATIGSGVGLVSLRYLESDL